MFLMLWVSDPGFAFAFSGLIAGLLCCFVCGLLFWIGCFLCGCCFGLSLFSCGLNGCCCECSGVWV